MLRNRKLLCQILSTVGFTFFSPSIFDDIAQVFIKKHDLDDGNMDSQDSRDMISLEKDVLAPLAPTGIFSLYKTTEAWRQIKTAGSALHANSVYLAESELRSRKRQSHLMASCPPGNPSHIVGNVLIHETASVDETAKIGPNVTIGPGVRGRCRLSREERHCSGRCSAQETLLRVKQHYRLEIYSGRMGTR